MRSPNERCPFAAPNGILFARRPEYCQLLASAHDRWAMIHWPLPFVPGADFQPYSRVLYCKRAHPFLFKSAQFAAIAPVRRHPPPGPSHITHGKVEMPVASVGPNSYWKILGFRNKHPTVGLHCPHPPQVKTSTPSVKLAFERLVASGS